MILAGVVLVYAVFIEPESVSLERVTIALPGLPRDLEGLTLLQISDVESRGRGRRENLVATLAAQARADIVVVTGDLVAKTLRGDSRLTATREAARLLGEIPSRYGTWFVEGHGEQLAPADRRKFLEALEDHGVHFLLDEVEPIRIGGAVLALAGIGLHPAGREAVFDQEPDGTIVDLGRGNAESFLNLLMPSGLPASEFEYSGEFRFSREEAGVGIGRRHEALSPRHGLQQGTIGQRRVAEPGVLAQLQDPRGELRRRDPRPRPRVAVGRRGARELGDRLPGRHADEAERGHDRRLDLRAGSEGIPQA
jgi:hypothetical protein